MNSSKTKRKYNPGFWATVLSFIDEHCLAFLLFGIVFLLTGIVLLIVGTCIDINPCLWTGLGIVIASTIDLVIDLLVECFY